jgi:SET domain-containing protein
MLKVRTRIDRSRYHGIGLFANEFIPKGTITWAYDHGFDPAYTTEEVDGMPSLNKDRFLDFSYFDYKQNKHILCSDDQRFINHSDEPNIESTPDNDRAIRDISIGEELTCDYEKYEIGWFDKRGLDRNFKKKLL